jgi:PPOX class probable F420-dependent enzyme
MSAAGPVPADFAALGAASFVSLTTFRRNGVAVSTPVWVAADGHDLVVLTPSASGKVKRLRNDARVELRPCSRRGAVAPDAPTVTGRAAVEPAAVEHVRGLVKAKYGLEYRVVMLIERIIARGEQERLGLRISPA